MGPLFLAADDMAGAWVHESLLIPFREPLIYCRFWKSA